MKLRHFSMVFFCCIAIAWPDLVIAQQPTSRVTRIGFLIPGSRDAYADYLSQFVRGLSDFGKLADRDYVLDVRWADGHLDRLLTLATELVDSKVDVLVVSSSGAAIAARKATPSIPIVQASGGDPVFSGLAASMSRPGGNVTGISNLAEDLSGKALEKLLLMAPNVLRVGILINADNPAHERRLVEIRQAARAFRVEAVAINAPSTGLDQAFAKVVQEDVGALMVLSDGAFLTERRSIVDRIAKVRLPALYQIREFVFEGGLMSLGINIGANYRRSAAFVDRILKGAKPDDLPIERPSKLELVINAKTAKALGREVPRILLYGADTIVD
jgi:putative tryptophan/tyrosine transport system substrate-binding protein